MNSPDTRQPVEQLVEGDRIVAHAHAGGVVDRIGDGAGVRVRDYPITLDKLLDRLPSVG